MSNFFSQMDKAGGQATQSRMSKLFSGVNFGSIGRQAGSQYATSFMAGLGPIGGAASDLALAIGPIGLAAGVAAAGIALIGAKSVQAAAAWESMATSIGRTTGLEGRNLRNFMDDLQDLRMEMGITGQAASDMAIQAGSIGVGQMKFQSGDMVGYAKELADFVKATAMLQGAWEGMSAEAVSAGIGRMGSTTINRWNMERREMGKQEMSWSEYALNVGGVVNSLADSMGSSEEQIVTAMSNMSGAVSHFAPDEKSYNKWLALASFIISKTGQSAETGTAFERLGIYAERNLDAYAGLLGTNREDVRTRLKDDYVGLFQDIGKVIADMPESKRPDLVKLFGLEGKKLMDPIIADIEAGTGELQDAIAKAMDPSSVLEGWDKVADDANTAFARIGQAAQVSFEQLGGVILPIVTDIANAVADAWQGMNVTGSELWKAGADIVENLSKGNLGDFALNGEWYNVSLSGIRKKTAEEIAAGAEQGAASASDAVADNLTSDISEKVTSELEEAAKKFDAEQEAYIKSHPGGMSVSNLYDTGEKSPITGKTIYEEGKPRIIGGSDGSKHEYGGLWGRGSGSIVAAEEGINYKISYSTDKLGTTSYLYIDGQLMGETRENSSKEAALQDLFSQPGAGDKLTKTLSLNLQGRGGEAALVTETVDLELDFDVDVATKNAREELGKFSQNMDWGEYLFGDRENTVLGELEWASNIGDDVAKAAVDDIGTALQDITPENYPKLVTGIEALNQKYGDMWSGFGPRSDVYTKLQSQYADAVLAGVIDAKDLLKTQSAETTSLLADSLSDGYISGAEKGALEARKTILELLKERYPVEFEAAGLDKLASDIQATLDGRAFSVDVKPEVDEFVANFALWKKSNAAVYEQIYAATGQIPTSTEQEERYKYERALAEEGSERSQAILRWLEEFDSALESNDVSSLVPIYETLLDYDPDLANQKWFTQLGEAGTSIAQKMMTAGDSAETLGGKFLDVASTMEAVNGRLMSLLSEARATTGMASWKQTVSQVNSSARKLNVPAGLTAAKTDTSYKISQFPGKLNIPKLAEGGKVTQGGLAWIGEAGPEIVIPEEDIKGLYPQSANVDKGSMSYLTSGRYFEDYPYEIRSESYKRGSFPNAPPVLTTGDMPVSWLSDQQTTGNEWISGEIRAAQLAAMGLTEDNVLKTPKVARALTNRDVWNAIYDNDGTCIAFVEPDPSLNFTPGADYMPGGKRWGNLDLPLGSYSSGSSAFYGGGVAAATPGGSTTATSALTAPSDALVMPGGITASDALTRRTAWNAIYDNNGTCIAFVEPDPSLNFTPGIDYLPGGKGLGNMGGGYTSLGDQEISTWDSVAESTRGTEVATEKVVENTRQLSMQTQRVADGLVMATGGSYGGYGGSGIIGLANRGGGAYWGGTSISGGGGWVAASPGPASGSRAAGWMNTGARAVGGSNAIQWAEGGFANEATFGVFGEAGREAFVPISDRAAGLRILPRVMQELGVATFAQGGIVQSQSVSGSGAVSSTLGQTIINGEASNQYATHSDGSLVSRGDINLSVYGDVARPQIREMMEQLKREWKEERDELVRILRQARFGGHY